MNLAFLAPLMLGGAALLVAPYLIHRIRRPEREPLRFSSLLFLPDVKKEVIERRRLQHILLMLTRMAILLLLALAFARPYAKAAIATVTSDAAAKHVILVDNSFSMAADDRLERAVGAAQDVLSGLGPEDEVAVVAFAKSADVLSPFASEADPDAGTASAARTALHAITVGEEATDYGTALREAQRLLLAETDGDDATRRVVHVFSDLQRTGMPGPAESWKLSPAIELDAVNVASTSPKNFAIADVIARRTLSKDIRVVGKVKNWSDEDADIVPVKLIVEGSEIEAIEKPVRAGNATQFSFTVPVPASGVLRGYLEVPDDAIPHDNRRYFVWSPPAKHDVSILAAEAAAQRDPADPATWPASWFLERGLPSGGEWPFTTDKAAPAQFVDASATADAPSAAIVSGLNDIDGGTLEAVRAFAAAGGTALVLLDSTGEAAKDFAESIGLQIRGLRFERPSPARYELLTRVDLNHPIFAGFQGHLYNDFSSIRFHQYVELAEPDRGGVQVLARFESDAPAVVEVIVGEGTIIVWPFSARLDATNLAKSSRFVPLLYETMRYLCRVEESESAWHVGDVLREAELGFDDTGRSRVSLPNEDVRIVARGELVPLDHAGIFGVGSGDNEGAARFEAVNVDAAESDPATMDADEFELKLAASPRVFEQARAESVNPEEASVAREYGILIMALVLAALLFESWYMARLTARRRRD